MTPDNYVGPEAASRLVIDTMLTASGWVVQDFKKIALGVARGRACVLTLGSNMATIQLLQEIR